MDVIGVKASVASFEVSNSTAILLSGELFRLRRLFGFLSWNTIAAWILAGSQLALASPTGKYSSFALSIRPILSEKCFFCHGPDETTRQADLRLDTAEGIESAFSSSAPHASEAWRRILTKDPDERMPPPVTGRQLTSGEISVLQKWIESGAEWSAHWAFSPPQKTEPPQLVGWGTGPIDAYIVRGLSQISMRPAPRAEKDILIRRLSFDLTGLPPTLKEIDEFLADVDPGAYERLVDRLLASPHYGERLASVWLDAARYSDTFGYQRDEDRFVWPWRDWVVRALNENLPYDEFVRRQVAGDLIDDATDDTILATTFNRLHGQNSEGGSIPEEFRAEYIADRTQTFATAMLGLTMECCKCHDHKYDPLLQRDFYALSAFFDKIDESGIKSFTTDAVPTPTLRLIDRTTREMLNAKQAAVDESQRKLDAIIQAEWEVFESAAIGRYAKMIDAPVPVASLTFDDDIAMANKQVAGKVGRAVRLTGDDEVVAAEGCAFDRADSFSLSLWIRTDQIHQRAVVLHRTTASLDSGSRGYELLIEQGKLSAALIHFWPGNAIRVQTRQPLPVGSWTHVAITYDGSSRASGMQLYIGGKVAEVEIVRDCLSKTAVDVGANRVAIGARYRDRGFTNGIIDELRIYDRQLSPIEVATLASNDSIDELIFALGADDWFEHYLLVDCARYRKASNELRSHRRELFAIENSAQEIMVMHDFPKAAPSRVRIRGAYDQFGNVVEPDVPAILPQIDTHIRVDRLALATWFARPNNPLAGRVAVNRIWQMIFGAGLVRTPEDFGAQGEPPSHPELLDYLAIEFVEGGWDVKALIKQIVMTEAYRQSSIASTSAISDDPENRMLSRATRYRWPAEMLRDNALRASGLLVNKIGGPPVKPYEVEASFSPSPRDTGDGLYRRSLYTYCKRSAPAPVMATFDAPDRSVCRVKREHTKSPLQALVLLNGPQFIEAARVLAERAVNLHGTNEVAAIEHIFRSLTSQYPTRKETAVLVELLQRQQRRFSQATERAEQILEIGDRPVADGLDQADVAAATIVAQTIMSCDKCVTRQ